MKLITVTGYKGGVAKSTSCIHIATYFSEIAPGKVLLVDGDRNRTSLSWAERGSLPFDVEDEKSALRVIQNYDYAIIDTPAQPSADDLKVLARGCDLLILPTSPDVVSLEPMIDTSRALNGSRHIALITIVPPKPSTEGANLKAELIAAEIPVFNTMIRRSAGITKAAAAGKPVRDMPARDRLAWLDYKALGKEIISLLDSAPNGE